MSLGVRIDESPNLFAIEVSGDLDVGNLPGLHDALQRAGRSMAASVAIDVDGLTSLDDAALGVINGTLRNFRAHGRAVWIVCNTPDVVERFRSHGLLDVVDLADSLHDIASR